MFVTNWISTTKIQKISEITNFFRHYFLSRTEVIICDCCTISLIAIFLCLGYIHFGGKGTHNFLTGKTGGCSILGIFPNIRRKLGFFMQNQLGNWLKTAKI